MLFITVQGIDLCHFFLCQLKIIQFCVFPNMLRVAGAWYDNNTFLQIPA